MDALIFDDGSFPGLKELLAGATFVSTPAEFVRQFDQQRCVVVDPRQLHPGDVKSDGSAILALCDEDAELSGWEPDDLVWRRESAAIVAARVRLWVQRKEERARLVHDLRTPLGVMLGNCQLLGEQLLGPLSPKQEKAVSALERQVSRLVEMVERAR